MGQTLRRATGWLRSANHTAPTKSSSVKDHKPELFSRPPSQSKSQESIPVNNPNWDPKADPNQAPDSNVLEQRDPSYDVMLNEMFGRVKVKPGGPAEMGDAAVVPKYNRPLPKLRNTSVNTGPNGERILAPGTLTVAQLHQMLLLHEGKAENQEKSMDAKGIAERFQLDVLVVQKILHYVSLPPVSNAAGEKGQD